MPKREMKVAIYSRVSTNSAEQLKSLAAQVSAFTRLVASTPTWLLVDVYMDVASGKSGSSRIEFHRLLEDCYNHKINIILVKNISRFGRDTVETIDALNQLKILGIRVIFEQENLDTADTDNELIITILEAVAQAENESRSANIKWGLEKRAANGSSGLYNRKCYGYFHDADGKLVIDEKKAKNVRLIFELYLQGQSVLGIIKELERQEIKSPTGKDRWCKRSIDTMLSNEKYAGTVRLLDSKKSGVQYMSEENNPPIISLEKFQAVQIERSKRSNVVTAKGETKRKDRKYSSKK